MKSRLVNIAIILACLSHANGAIYHVDSARGNDAASGLSPAQAWRSLEKANAIELKPGDRLLFKAGGQWSGQLKPKGSGTDKGIIKIGSYGKGPLPRIDGEGKVLDTVLLENFEYVDLVDLEITNQGPQRAPWRTGVRISANGMGKMRRIAIRRLFVHDVNGDLRKSQEGCGIFFQAKGGKQSHFDGLLIEKCHLQRTDRNGICQRGAEPTRSLNVIIRGNTLEDIGGDGIKLWGTNGGLIERNVIRKARARCTRREAAAGIWPFACDDTLIQFNEVSGTMGTMDGQAYDSDFWCRRTVFQYNYSFENEGGFMLICSPGKAVNEDTVIRYNVSVHDGGNSARVFHFGGGATRTHVYNNTIILGAHQNLPMMLFTAWDGGTAHDSRFTNNLFIVGEGGRASYRLSPSSGNVFESNLFVGRHDGLPEGCKLAPAPDLTGPLVPKPGPAALKRFRPAKTSSFPKGMIIPNNGGRDILGNPLPSGPPSIGAIER